MQKASNQANRAVRFVNSHLSQMLEDLSINVSNKEAIRIFPVIITNLFGFTGLVINSVPVCDFSALGKFATDKYVYRITKNKEGINRVPFKELYKGDVPTATELLNQLHKPFQVESMAKNIKITSITQPMTKELILKIFDVRKKETNAEGFETD